MANIEDTNGIEVEEGKLDSRPVERETASSDANASRPPVGLGATQEERESRELNVSVGQPSVFVGSKFTNKVIQGLIQHGSPDDFATAIALDRGKLQWAYQQYTGKSPERAALFAKIVRERGVPREIVEADPERWAAGGRDASVLQLYKDLTAVDPETGKPKHPGAYSWLLNPSKMAVGKYYTKALTKLDTLYQEQYGQSLGEWWDGKNKEALVTFGAPARKYGKFFEVGLASAWRSYLEFGTMMIGKLDEKKYNTRVLHERLEKLKTDKWFNQVPPKTQGLMEQFMGDLITGYANSMTGFAVAAPLALVGGTTGAVLGTLAFVPMMVGGLHMDLKDVKGIDDETKFYIALGGGLIGSGLEAIGLKKVLDSVLGKNKREAVKHLLDAFGAEFITESLQTIVEKLSKEYGVSLGEGEGLWDAINNLAEKKGELAMEALYSGILGGILGGVTGVQGLGVGVTLGVLDRRAEVKAHKKAYEDTINALTETQMTEKAPDEMEDYLDHLAVNNNAATHVYAPLSKLKEFYQDELKDTLEDFLERNDISEEEVKKAEDTGAYVKVKKTKYMVQNHKKPVLEFMQDEIRFSETGASVNELKAAEAEIKENIKKVQQRRTELDTKQPARLASNPRIQEMRKTLIKPVKDGGMGMDAKSADAIAAGYVSRAMVAEATYRDTVADKWLEQNVPEIERIVGDKAIPTGRDTFYTFGGNKAQTAQLGPLMDAAARIKTGQNAEAVRRDTGWFKGLGNAWKFEIDDSLAVIKKVKFDLNVKNRRLNDISKPLDEVLVHPKLYQAYPFLRDIKVYMKADLDAAAEYSNSLGVIRLEGKTNFITQKQKADLLHEVQHAIQDYEGTARGTSRKEAKKIIAKRKGISPDQVSEQEALVFYAGTAGEIEARDVARREKLSKSERQRKSPIETTLKGFQRWAKAQGVANAQIELLFQEGELTGEPKAAVTFETGKNPLVKIFEKADFSSILHESMHIFVNDMQEAVKNGIANEQVATDLETLKDFAGGKFDREGIEKVVRASEVYFREGRAPSIKLRNAFRTFKSWLTTIYKSVSQLNVEISPEVREVFDRMFASAQEIEDVKLLYESSKQLEEVLEASDKQKVEIKEKRQKADTSSIEKRAAKLVDAHLRATDGRKELRKQAEKYVNEMPEYKHMDSVISQGGIDPSSLEKYLDKKSITALRRKFTKNFIPTTNTGVSAAQAAIEGKYGSVEEYIAVLQDMTKKSTAVTTRTQALIDQRIADFQQELERSEDVPAEEEYHTPERLDVLIAEEQLLLEQVEKATANRLEVISKQAYKEAVENYIRTIPISRATQWHQFGRTEQKYSREAIEAAERGDMLAAHEAKKRQILNHMLVQEAIKIKEFAAKVGRKYSTRRITKRTNAIDPSLADMALDLVHHYRLNSKVYPKKPRVSFDFAALDEGLQAMIPEWVAKKQLPENEGTDSWRALTAGELRALDDAITRIIGFGSQELSTFVSEQRKDFEAVKAEILKTGEGVADAAITKRDRDNIPKILAKTDALISDYARNQLVFEMLDGNVFNKTGRLGAWSEIDYQGGVVKEAENTKLQAEIIEKARPHLAAMSSALKGIEKRFGGKNFTIQGVPVTPQMEASQQFTWTADRLFAVALNMGNADNVRALKEGNGFSQGALDNIAGIFSDTEWDAIQGIWDVTNSLRGVINETHRKMYGVSMRMVEAEAFVVTTSDGVKKTVKGGYYPMAYDPKDKKVQEQALGKKDEKDVDNFFRTRSAMAVPDVNHDFTKGRGKKPYGGLLLDPSVFFRHVVDTSRFVTHGAYVRDLRRLLQDKDIAAMVRRKTGDKVYHQVMESLKHQARPERQFYDLQSDRLDAARRKATPVILGGSMAVPLKQRGSMLNTISDIGWTATIDGMLSMLGTTVTGLPLGKKFDMVEKKSAYLRARTNYGTMSQAVHDAKTNVAQKYRDRKFNIKGKVFTWDNVVDLNFMLIRMQDRATIYPLWLGAYNKYMRQNRGEAADVREANAIKFADNMMRKQHPSALPADLNSIQRNPKGAMRLFAVFMTYRMVHANRLIFNTKAMLDGKMPFNKWARVQFTEQIFMGMMMQAISALAFSGELPEWWELLLLGPALNIVGAFPVAAMGLNAAYQGVVKRDIRALERAAVPTAFTGMQRYLKAGKSTVDFLNDDGEYSEVLLDYGKVMEYHFQIPGLSLIEKTLRLSEKIDKR